MSKPVGPYTPAMHAGDFLMISGQIGHVDGTLVAVSYTHLTLPTIYSV